MVKNILLYGFESWKITERNKKKLEALEMDVFRRMMRIARRE